MTTRYIIDASVAVKWFYKEPLRTEAYRYFGSHIPLNAPDIIQQEFASAILKKSCSRMLVQRADGNPTKTFFNPIPWNLFRYLH